MNTMRLLKCLLVLGLALLIAMPQATAEDTVPEQSGDENFIPAPCVYINPNAVPPIAIAWNCNVGESVD